LRWEGPLEVQKKSDGLPGAEGKRNRADGQAKQ
jgi:hypothetical protein